jgi:hypothetical protein
MLQQSLEQWRKVFGVTAIVAVGTYFMFQFYGTSDIQAWNYPNKKYPCSVMQPLTTPQVAVITENGNAKSPCLNGTSIKKENNHTDVER